jgi:hypothetical protein
VRGHGALEGAWQHPIKAMWSRRAHIPAGDGDSVAARPHKIPIGPVRNGILGRKAGSIEGYNYTPANKNSGLTWDEATLKEYLKNPRAKIPGTRWRSPGSRARRTSTTSSFLQVSIPKIDIIQTL